MESNGGVEVLMCQTVTKDIKGESEEDHGVEYIKEIDIFQTDKLQLPHKVENFNLSKCIYYRHWS